jgi:WD40 repeat protein
VPGLTAIELSPGADRLELRRSRGTDQTFDLSTGTLWSTPSYKQSRRQSVWQFSSPTNPLGIPSASLIQVGRIGSERFVVAAGVFGLKFFQLEVSSAQPALRLVYSIPEATGITALAISPDGSRVAWATSDRTIKVLLVPSPLSLFAELELDNAAREARQAANNDFGNTPPPAEDPRQTLERDRLIARGKIILDRIDQASDAPVQVAHNRTGTPKPELWIIQNISVAGTTQTLSFSPDNRLLASSAGPEGRRGGDGVIYVYQLSRQNLQKIFFNRGVSPPLSYSFHLACTEVAPYLRYMAGRTQVPIDNIDFHSLQKSCAEVLKSQ